MTEFLYPNFLSEEADYAGAEGAWLGAWHVLLSYAGGHGDWKTPWVKTAFLDGTRCRDGNPIFSAYSPARRLGIRIIQLESAGDPEELTFWADYYAKGDESEVKELVIACVLTNTTLADATDLMAQWVDRGEVTVADARELTRSRLAFPSTTTTAHALGLVIPPPRHRLRVTNPSSRGFGRRLQHANSIRASNDRLPSTLR
jgi:hypothetical protein